MHIRKYDFDYGRRMLMEKALKGVATAGVLSPLWPEIARSADISKSYPDELLHIEAYTKGAVKPGDTVSAANVEAVKDLMDPILYQQVKTMGRKIQIVESTRDVTKMYPAEYLEATLRNKGRAKFDADGNVVDDKGGPWIGGSPFPDAKDALEAFANLTLSWGRHDTNVVAIRDWDIAPDGSQSYQYDFVWVEYNTVALVGPGGPYRKGEEDKLRYNSIFWSYPNDVKGTAFLSIWHYDQRKFPDLHGYLPAFKRVRRFPTNQRFEPLVPGMTLFLSDAWATGDPMLTWGNYKIVGRKPHLGAVSNNFYGSRPNWERPVHGGQKDQTFFDTRMELVPEVLVVEAEPVGYPRAPVGKKRVWIDVRNSIFVAYNTYDRRGEVWKSFEPGFGQFIDGKTTIMDGKNPVWNWTYVMCHDIQSGRMSRWQPTQQCAGGYTTAWNLPPESVFDKYLTIQAIGRLGV